MIVSIEQNHRIHFDDSLGWEFSQLRRHPKYSNLYWPSVQFWFHLFRGRKLAAFRARPKTSDFLVIALIYICSKAFGYHFFGLSREILSLDWHQEMRGMKVETRRALKLELAEFCERGPQVSRPAVSSHRATKSHNTRTPAWCLGKHAWGRRPS